MSEEEFEEVLKNALKIMQEQELEEVKGDVEQQPPFEPSDKFKRKMNRLFREKIGGEYAMYPEVDNEWERLHSGFLRGWNIMVNYIYRVFEK